MSSISLRQTAQSLGANNVSGMTQKVGLKWPPPPPVSVRDLVARAAQNVIVAYRRFIGQDLNHPDQRITVGSFAGNNPWDFINTLEGTGSFTGPSLAIFQGRLFMAYRGTEGDEGIWVSTSADAIHWDPHQSINGTGSLLGPSLAAFQDQLYMVYRGVQGDEQLYWTRTSDGVQWKPDPSRPDPQRQLGGTTSGVPALVTFGDGVLAVWRGIEGDQQLWYSIYRGGTQWPTPQTIPNKGSEFGVGLGVFQGQIIMAYRGINDDQGIYWAHSDDGEHWSDQLQIPGIGTDNAPTLTSWRDRLYMIYKGIDNDPKLYWTWMTANSSWQSQQIFPDSFTGGWVSAVTF
jgi:hypothetical protein